MLVEKKELIDVVQERFPGKRFGVIKSESTGIVTLYYDAYMLESEVNKLAEFVREIKAEVTLERMIF